MGLWGAGARYGVGAVEAIFWAALVFKPQLCPIEARCGTPVPRSGVRGQRPHFRPGTRQCEMDRRQPEASSPLSVCCVSEGTRLSGLCVTEELGGETGSWSSQAPRSAHGQMGLTV